MNQATLDRLQAGGEPPSADAPASGPALDPPDDLGEVLHSISRTVLGLWDDFVTRVPFLLAALAVLLPTWAAAVLVHRLLPRILGGRRMRRSLQELIERLVSIAVWAVGLMLAMVIVFPGLTPARALGALGLVSIAVGFAFKDIFENFFAGILLLWRFPFENGDFVECEGVVGRVEEVTIRMTQIRLVSGELTVVPNSFLFKNPVKVLTDRRERRVTILVGVAYGESVAQSVEVIERAVSDCESIHSDQPVQVFPQGFGASSIDIEVAWWTDPEPVDVRRSRGEVVTAVKSALDDAGIEIPFPYRTLTFKEPLPIEGRPAASDA